jgi:hypothetical protein
MSVTLGFNARFEERAKGKKTRPARQVIYFDFFTDFLSSIHAAKALLKDAMARRKRNDRF